VTTLATLRAALAANLRASISNVQVSEYALSQPTPPGVQIIPGEVQYDLAMQRGYDIWTFQVQAFVDFSADVGSQVVLDALIDQIKTAIESDKTLGGAAFGVQIRTGSGYRMLDRAGGGQLLVFEFPVLVHFSN
jgi:hypothetical protein